MSVSMLVVEDDAGVASVIRSLLRRLGMTVEVAGNADEACRRLLRPHTFQFVLSDCRMPGAMDGMGLADWCREHLPHLRVLLMSGFSDRQRDAQYPTLAKPFSLDELRAFLSAQGVLEHHPPRLQHPDAGPPP